MTSRRLLAALAFAVLVLSGCPCWVPAPPHSPRRMMQVEAPRPWDAPVKVAPEQGGAAQVRQ